GHAQKLLSHVQCFAVIKAAVQFFGCHCWISTRLSASVFSASDSRTATASKIERIQRMLTRGFSVRVKRWLRPVRIRTAGSRWEGRRPALTVEYKESVSTRPSETVIS